MQNLVFLRTTKTCTKVYITRVKLMFYLLNLLFGSVLVAVVIVVCLSSLISD